VRVRHLEKKECKTENITIHGHKKTNEKTGKTHLYIYGTDIPKIIELQNKEPELKEKNYPDYDTLAIRYEMARTIDDV
jgi:glycerol-3-phosphate dehydrogenase